MARLPNVGGDSGTWGDILNEFLLVEHNSDGTLQPIPQSNVINLTQDLDDKADQADLDTEISDRQAGDTAGLNRANHTGSQTASTISDFNAAAVAATENIYANTAAVTPVQVQRTSGAITASVTAQWTDLDPGGTAAARPLDIVLPNMSEGDFFDFRPIFSIATANGGWLLNLVVVVNGAVVRRCFPPGGFDFGFIPWAAVANTAKDINMPTPRLSVQAGDLENGSLRLRLQYTQGSVSRTVQADTTSPLWLEGRGPLA